MREMKTSQPGARAQLARSRLIEAIFHNAQRRPGAQAVGEVDGGRESCTYGELSERIRRRAAFLSRSLAPGQVLLCVLPSGVEFVVWACAAIAADVRFLPMHPQVAGPEARAIADRIHAAAAIVAPGLAAAGALGHLAMPESEDDARVSDRRDEWVRGNGSVVLGSSGTTGLPKLVLRSASSLDADAAGVITGMGLTGEDRVVFATPLSHSYGVDVLVGTLMAGATLRVLAQFDAEALGRELEGGATVLPAVPFIFEAMSRRPAQRASSLRLTVSAGSPLSDRVRRQFSQAWGIEVGQLYGASELGTVTMDIPGRPGFDPASVGRPLPGVSVRVVDVDNPNTELEVGREGQLAVRADSMLSEYLDADLNLADGHLLTGDLARVDANGRVWITGRLKLLIDVGAYKVNPLEVESVLSMHPSVEECVIVPVSASETVQRLRAVVVLRGEGHPVGPEELRQFLRDRLSPIKVPRVVEVVASLPKSATGKVLRDRVMEGKH